MTDLTGIADVRVLVLFGLIAAFYAVLIIREFGRLIACQLIGWDVYLLKIRPLVVRFKPFAIRLGNIPGIYSAGWVLAYPPAPEKQTKWRVAIFNKSGVALNFICIVAILVVLEVAPQRSVLLGFVFFAVASLSVAIMPKQVLRDQNLSHFDIVLSRATALRASGIMPGQFDSALVDALEAGADPGTVETDDKLSRADICLYEHYFDLEKYEKARGALDRAISRTQISDRRWDGLWIENAFFSAFIERNIPVAEESLAKLKDPKRRKYYPYRQALAAIAIARGDGREALRLLRRVHRSSVLAFDEFGKHIHSLVVRAAQRLVRQ